MCALLFGKAPTQEKQAPCIDDAVRYAGAVRTLACLRAGSGIRLRQPKLSHCSL